MTTVTTYQYKDGKTVAVPVRLPRPLPTGKNTVLFQAKPSPIEPRVVLVKAGFDFRTGQRFMLDEARRAGFDLKKLQSGNYVVFLNRALTRMRLLTTDAYGDPVYAVKNMPAGRFIDPRVIQYLPLAFRGGRINYERAEQAMVVQAYLEQHRRRNPSALPAGLQ
jgi:hypothetical protein